jgi:hypothetical protein
VGRKEEMAAEGEENMREKVFEFHQFFGCICIIK